MVGRTVTLSMPPELRATAAFVRPPLIDRNSSDVAARKDILNATFTLLSEYEIGRSAVLAAVGGPDDAVDDFDAFTELRKPIRRHR
jgi:hypothetical protein